MNLETSHSPVLHFPTLGTPRTRFVHDTFPTLSMAVFDRLVSNLSEVYFHSNPETKQVFAPAHAPDLLYNLIWTLLFIDQEFRNPRAQSKVTCRYFVRLMQREGSGYPLEFFDKRALKVKTTIIKIYLHGPCTLLIAVSMVFNATTLRIRTFTTISALSLCSLHHT